MRAFGGSANLSNARRLEIGHEYLLAANSGMLEVMSIIQNGIQQIGENLAQEKMKTTVQHLPDETLMQIFELVFDCENGANAYSLRRGFPLVCKRWRTLVTAIPRFWNDFQIFQSPGYTEACLERSQNVGIDLHMFITRLEEERNDIPAKTAKFCEQLLPHSPRWESLRITAFNVMTSVGQALFDTARTHYGSLDLPNLRSLYIVWTSDDGTSDEEMLNNDSLHLYSSWSMPHLSKLEMHDLIPRACIGHTLTTCNLSFGPERWTNMNLVFVFLRSLTRVEKLKLSFHYVMQSTWPNMPVSFPNLRRLDLDFHDVAHNAHELVPLLDIPNVTKIKLAAAVEHWVDLHHLLTCFEREESYASVKSFSLCVQRRSTVFDRHINKIFNTFRNLEHLGISAHDAIPSRRLRSQFNCRSLRTVSFGECNAFNGNIAEAIIHQVERDGRLEEFEKLEVIDCPTFRYHKNDLVEKLSKKKIDWEEFW